MRKASNIIPVILIVLSLFGCNGGEMKPKGASYKSLSEVPDRAWESLSQKRLYFGHQSVGYNIIEGIQDIQKENPRIRLNIVEQRPEQKMPKGVFGHSRIGENGHPVRKIDEFGSVVGNGIGADAAFVKLCYVDFNENTDVDQLFAHYRQTMEKLQQQHPETVIIHLTAPLQITPSTWKTRLKRMIGKDDIWEYRQNLKRNAFNRLMREAYSGKQPLLDIAGIESTHPDGAKETFEFKGEAHESLFRGYTYDGGHLNEVGRKKVAEQLLILLANLS